MHFIIKRDNEKVSAHQLSRGERDYIRRQGIRDEEFDRMTPLAKKQWVEETKIAAYEENLKK